MWVASGGLWANQMDFDTYMNNWKADNNLTLNTASPDLTDCFQQTALLWLPCGYLWLCSLVYLPFLCNWPTQRRGANSRSLLLIFKQIINAALVVSTLTELIYTISRSSQEELPLYRYLSPAVALVSYVYVTAITEAEHRKAVHSSGYLQTFWFLMVLTDIVPARSKALHAESQKESQDKLSFVLFYLTFILLCLQFLLSFPCDYGREPDDISEEQKPLLANSTENTKGDENNSKHAPCPEGRSSFLANITHFWIAPLLIKGYKRPVTFDDVYQLSEDNKCKTLLPKFDQEWNKSKERRSLLVALLKSITGPFFISGLFRIALAIFAFISPQLLRLLINFISSKDPYTWKGYVLAVLLFVNKTLDALTTHIYFKYAWIMSQRLRSVVITAVYRKALRLSNAARRDTTVGEIVNLMAVDAQKIHDTVMDIHELWAAPLMVAAAMYFLWDILGISSLAALGLMLIIAPFNGGYLARGFAKLQVQQMKHKDARIKLINEILSGIKVLKFYAWEPSFLQKVYEVRQQELVPIKKAAFLSAAVGATWFSATYLVSLAVFTTYVLINPEHVLPPDVAFVSMNIINILNFTMSFLPIFIAVAAQAYVSIRRIRRMLNEDELDPESVQEKWDMEEDVAIENGTFTWEDEEHPVLKEINLKVKPGSLVAVVGQVGAGKSTLLAAILGELRKTVGSVFIKGTTAFVAQQAWIQNLTLKDNILFSKTYSDTKYNKVLDACALRPDLEILPAKDMTEIGEKGINLSGGQKQRVSLARAVYQDRDIYLLDDVLSAVDAHVGKHIFRHVIGPSGMLKSKTRVLVTHGVTYLPEMDEIVVMKDGCIAENGTYEELLQNDGAFAEFIRTYLKETENEEEQLSDPESKEIRQALQRRISHISDKSGSEDLDPVRKNKGARRRRNTSRSLSRTFSEPGSGNKLVSKSPSMVSAEGKLIETEEEAVGRVKVSVLRKYIKSGSWPMFVLVIISSIFYAVSVILTSIWLRVWSDDQLLTNITDPVGLSKLRLGVYGGLGILQILAICGLSLAIFLGGVYASRKLHADLTLRILRAPMSFFDTTPLGRIVNRFSTDIDKVDNNIPIFVRAYAVSLAYCLSAIVLISYSTPIFLVALVPILFIYLIVQRVYIQTVRQLKRIDSVRKSPIYSHFDETLVGVSTVRAYGHQQRFFQRNQQLMDESQMAWYPILVGQRWLAFTLEVIGAFIIFFASVFAVLQRDTLTGGLVGLSVSFSLDATFDIYMQVRAATDLETYVVSVERIIEYSELDTEAEWVVPECRPSADWPAEGNIEMEEFSTRYRPDLDLVLNNITATFKAGEKVGIVGRTGAGKSSLTLSLFRIIEAAGGKIRIDGVNIADIGLHDLRSKLTIIPQDPVLFSGTLRMNLDPFDTYKDEELWNALDHAHLKRFVESLSNQLQYECGEGGSALSVGQRQLVCLARALLRKTRILILDEATAAVDMETDDLIQQTIRQEFRHCTVLTIAHRINTVLDYDRVVVLDKGKVTEMDSPNKLLSNTNSVFYSMARNVGLV